MSLHLREIASKSRAASTSLLSYQLPLIYSSQKVKSQELELNTSPGPGLYQDDHHHRGFRTFKTSSRQKHMLLLQDTFRIQVCRVLGDPCKPPVPAGPPSTRIRHGRHLSTTWLNVEVHCTD